ncbi:MAG: class I SAM-dependent methyltransferase [Deltaproteobacteria bacterium]|nr:class I SAM-dependent methyltransferase [Deltaproteobacteria bacterium]
MGQMTTGLRSVLSHPWIYDAFQNLMGARIGRRDFSANFVRPYPGCRLLDMGCGTAQILDYLPEGVEYWGYDIHPGYIAAARRRFGEKGRFACRLLEESELAGMPPFDIVLASGLLHHLDDDAARDVFRLAKRALRPGGRFVSIDPVFAENQNPLARMLISRDRGRNVRDAQGYLALARREFDLVEGVVRHRSWVPYTHWIMECVRA